jgi:3-deoxy-D-manno-octulosonic-acid transferase
MPLSVYRHLTGISAPFLTLLLKRRLKKGKEDAKRWTEKTGKASLPRPKGTLIWLHAASVGEVQSSLILIDKLLETSPDLHILVTSGTVTSAAMLAEKLPERTFHQYAPLDHPAWITQFLDYWRPDLAIRIESELWPNILLMLKERGIPSLLINARLSASSFNKWKKFKKSAAEMLGTFDLILCQTKKDADYYRDLGADASGLYVTGNLKYSAQPLPCDPTRLKSMKSRFEERPGWIYASTHYDEESLAAHVHERLKKDIPDLLTVIVPRHPERGDEIEASLSRFPSLKILRRGADKIPPRADTDIYLADTLGELGLFYRLAPIACIGRSFSADGGGGHNPLEPAQLGAAVLHGPHVQNLQALYDDMKEEDAAIALRSEDDLYRALKKLLTDPAALKEARTKAKDFAKAQTGIIDIVLDHLQPFLPNKMDDTA